MNTLGIATLVGTLSLSALVTGTFTSEAPGSDPGQAGADGVKAAFTLPVATASAKSAEQPCNCSCDTAAI